MFDLDSSKSSDLFERSTGKPSPDASPDVFSVSSSLLGVQHIALELDPHRLLRLQAEGLLRSS